MKLRDLLDYDRLLLVACEDCTGRTPLDPAPFALRLGVQAGVTELKTEIVCPVCGSADFQLTSFSPLERAERAPVNAPDGRP